MSRDLLGYVYSAMGRYEILEHTADKGLEVYAEDLGELFRLAGQGLFALMIDTSRYPPTDSVPIVRDAPDLEMLVVRLLNELLYQFEVYHRLFSEFDSVRVESRNGRWYVEAQAWYRPIQPAELEWEGAPVKSVTYHGLTLEHTESGWFLRFYVDV